MFRINSFPFKFASRFLFENLANTGRTKKQLLSFFIDAIIVAFSIWAAFSLRLAEPYFFLNNIAHLLLFMPPLTVLLFASLGIYRWVVRSSSSRQFEQLIKGAIISSFGLLVVLYLIPITFAPRSIFLIYGLILIFLTTSYRFIWSRLHSDNLEATGKPVAIYGAGAAGRQLENLMRISCEYQPKFFIDDSYALIGSTVAGLNVYGSHNPTINQEFQKNEVAEIILAMPSISAERYSSIVSSLDSTNIPIKTIPSITDIVSGRKSPDDIQEIELEDLLGRDAVEPDYQLLQKHIRGKKVLITGAGGSIGSELCRQAANIGAHSIILVEHSEASLYEIQQELLEIKNHDKSTVSIITALASVTDKRRIKEVFARYSPDTVYHAAANKHVPMVENHPFEGVKTNIFGTINVVLAAEKNRVKMFVLISTDKAVRPTNIMGATKRIAELVLQARAAIVNQKTTYCMVRFGNVLGSSGSVVPTFKKQIKNGGPVTITHQDMTRYFMTISEAVSLVIQAGSIAKGGEVFLLDMGNPVKIINLAKAMIRLHGGRVLGINESTEQQTENGSIEIAITGIRPGEKLFEELLIDKQSSSKTVHPKINKGSELFIESEELERECLEPLLDAVERLNVSSLKKVIAKHVTGYREKIS